MTGPLQKINKFITIPRSDRQSRTEEFNEIRARVVQQLKKQDPFFGLLYKDWRLGGSYADNLKIKQADEFDLVLHLKIDTNYYDVKVTECSEFPGFCNIQLTEKQNSRGTDYQSKMRKFLNKEGFLIENKFNKWLNNLMELVAIENKSLGDSVLTYSTSGPAQTVTATSKKHGQTSYDFVPAFIFDHKILVVEREISEQVVDNFLPEQDLCWIALPKPLEEYPDENKSFLTSFVNIERHLIANKYHLKNTLRMMKKFRDVKRIKNLKSYFIKTIYLWENEAQLAIRSEEQKKGNEYKLIWQKSEMVVLKHMFQRSIEFFQNKNLPFFWHRQQNMIANLNQVNINNILHHLNDALTKLGTESDEIYDVFLTDGEKRELKSNINDDNLVEDTGNASSNSEDYAFEEDSGSKNKIDYSNPYTLSNFITVKASTSSKDHKVEDSASGSKKKYFNPFTRTYV